MTRLLLLIHVVAHFFTKKKCKRITVEKNLFDERTKNAVAKNYATEDEYIKAIHEELSAASGYVVRDYTKDWDGEGNDLILMQCNISDYWEGDGYDSGIVYDKIKDVEIKNRLRFYRRYWGLYEYDYDET